MLQELGLKAKMSFISKINHPTKFMSVFRAGGVVGVPRKKVEVVDPYLNFTPGPS